MLTCEHVAIALAAQPFPTQGRSASVRCNDGKNALSHGTQSFVTIWSAVNCNLSLHTRGAVAASTADVIASARGLLSSGDAFRSVAAVGGCEYRPACSKY